jgi:hypothetical protein
LPAIVLLLKKSTNTNISKLLRAGPPADGDLPMGADKMVGQTESRAVVDQTDPSALVGQNDPSPSLTEQLPSSVTPQMLHEPKIKLEN